MIYTITLNPSIDYFVEVTGPMKDTEVNRADSEKFKGGGKGINVSMVLNELKIHSTAIALLGGFTGNFIQDYLQFKEHITLKPIPVAGMNRINVKIHNEDKTLYINGNGPQANEETKAKLLQALNQVNASDWVILSGSSTQNIPFAFIKQIADLVHNAHAKFVVDMESLTLEKLNVLKPTLIKPNLYEFSMLVGTDITEINMDVNINRVLNSGAMSVLISLGASGAIYADHHNRYRLHHESMEAINKVGSGDAMLAAFVGKQSSGYGIEESLRWAGACGNAAVSTLEDIDYETMIQFLDKMHIQSY